MTTISRLLVAGTLLRERYKIERVLGNGGSSTVYLASDLSQSDTDKEQPESAYVALKELHTDNRQEQMHFAFEGRVLKKLKHRALPCIYDVYEDDQQRSSFLILEYIEGPDLEILRRQQPAHRFSLDSMMQFMQPIIDATIYLHHQQPAVIHRDIKPSNIIIMPREQRAVLIDFGIAKEYEIDATTSALRHCTPGYGAPEQYGNLGTDARTDIYALAATCYCLLTGMVPVDAFERTATIVSKRVDPLKPAHTMVPEIPLHVSQAIERAMEISMEQRFTRVEDFWLALRQAPPEMRQAGLNGRKVSATVQAVRKASQKPRRRVRQMFAIAGAIVLLSIVLTVGAMANVFQTAQPIHSSNGDQSTPTAIIHQSTTTPTATSHYPHLSTAYKGTLSDLSNKQATGNITLTGIQQQQQQISGHFTGLNRSGSFTGVMDSSNHILITIAKSNQQPPLFFEGIVRSDGNLVGDYCNQDQSGQCVGNYGLWSLSPTP